jgi:hypothetical protein
LFVDKVKLAMRDFVPLSRKRERAGVRERSILERIIRFVKYLFEKLGTGLGARS